MAELQAPPASLLDKYEGEAVLPLYTTEVQVSGGVARHARASGAARSSDGALDVQLRLPKWVVPEAAPILNNSSRRAMRRASATP